MEVTAAVVRKFGAPFSMEQLVLGPPRPDEVLVRVVATGLCHTDLNARDGGMPIPENIVLGHEGAGVVVEVGSAVHHVEQGDHVVLTVDSCGSCRSCRLAQPAHCEDLFALNLSGGRRDGSSAFTGDVRSHFMGQSSLSTATVASGSSVIPVAKDLPLELLGPLGCAVQTGAGSVMRALRVTPGSSVAVFGAGAVGLSAVSAAAIAGATCIVAVDRVDSRLALARQFGATDVISIEDSDVTASIRDLTSGGVDYSIECAGSTDALRIAVDVLRSLGHCAVVGGVRPGTLASYDWRPAQGKGVTIHAVVEGDAVPSEFIPILVDLVRRGRLPLADMVTYFEFDQIEEAARAAESGEVIKPILCMPA